MSVKQETAVLGGGCFWCLEAVFQGLKGVSEAVSGYSGGMTAHPAYEQVCTGVTGHAEVVRIVFDPDVISFEELLEVFWRIHDPTTPNRQGNDVGTQYRSVIFYLSAEQKAAAERSMGKAASSGLWADPIVTELAPFTTFYEAEAYHRNYFVTNPDQPYCRVIIDPKVRKFRKEFSGKLREQ